MFEVKHFCNGWVKKDGVNANLIQHDCTNHIYTSIDFAFSLLLPKVTRLTSTSMPSGMKKSKIDKQTESSSVKQSGIRLVAHLIMSSMEDLNNTQQLIRFIFT